MLRKFVLKAVIFALPILLISSIPFALGIWFGDMLPNSRIVELQEIHNGAYRIGGGQDRTIDYKIYRALDIDADFLVFGSSRFILFRGEFITNPEHNFYNAVVLGITTHNLRNMLEVIAAQDAMPEILFLNLDLINFNADRTDFHREEFPVEVPNVSRDLEHISSAFRSLALDILLAPQSILAALQRVRETPNGYFIGREGSAYGLDGSWYGSSVINQFALHEQSWQEGSQIFEAGAHVDAAELDALREIIALAEANNTLIVASLPPYYPDFYERLQASADHSYFNAARTAIADVFAETDMIFYDFSDPAQTSVRSDMFYDAWHVTEVGTLAYYLDIINANPNVFAPYSDTVILNELLANAVNSYSLHEDDLP